LNLTQGAKPLHKEMLVQTRWARSGLSINWFVIVHLFTIVFNLGNHAEYERFYRWYATFFELGLLTCIHKYNPHNYPKVCSTPVKNMECGCKYCICCGHIVQHSFRNLGVQIMKQRSLVLWEDPWKLHMVMGQYRAAFLLLNHIPSFQTPWGCNPIETLSHTYQTAYINRTWLRQ
jgi:hypothetical protein